MTLTIILLMTVAGAWTVLTNMVTVCSLLSLMLPAVEDFDEFPRFQPYYRLFCKIVIKWGSLSLRGKILEARGINTGNGGGT